MNSLLLYSRRLLTGGLALVLLASGCTTHTSRTEKQGTAIGTGVGALAGAVVGKQLFGDQGGVIMGAAMGAIIGAAAGQSWAERVEAARKKYQTEEERLNATLNASGRIQTELLKENEELGKRVARSRTVVQGLLKDYEAKKVTKEKLAAEKKDLDARRKKAEEARVDLEKAIASEETALAAAKRANLAAAATLEKQLIAQRTELANLQRLERELLSLSTSLDI